MEYFEILIKLRKVFRSVNLESKRIEKELGISIPQLLVLRFLSTRPEYRALAKDIKEHIQLNASTVTGILNRLERKGLVARIAKSDDRRAAYVTLTAMGAELLAQSPHVLPPGLSRQLQELGPHRMAALSDHIELLAHLLDADGPDRDGLDTLLP